MNWSKRLAELLLACGWTQKVAADKFGVCHPVIARVLRGLMPRSKVKFLLRMKQLEAAYAGDIEALRAGAIVKFGHGIRTRVDFRRKENISPLGADEAVGEDRRFGTGEREAVAPRVVYLSPQARRRVAQAKKAQSRRSKAIHGGTGDTAA